MVAVPRLARGLIALTRATKPERERNDVGGCDAAAFPVTLSEQVASDTTCSLPPRAKRTTPSEGSLGQAVSDLSVADAERAAPAAMSTHSASAAAARRTPRVYAGDGPANLDPVGSGRGDH